MILHDTITIIKKLPLHLSSTMSVMSINVKLTLTRVNVKLRADNRGGRNYPVRIMNRSGAMSNKRDEDRFGSIELREMHRR